jgi:hypothetical protein
MSRQAATPAATLSAVCLRISTTNIIAPLSHCYGRLLHLIRGLTVYEITLSEVDPIVTF